MALFLSTHTNKLDIKGRISIPASFKSSLVWKEGHQFVALRSFKHPAIDCCTMERLQHLSETVDQMEIFSETQDDFTATLFADAQPLSIDREGRTVLPQNLIHHANLTDQGCFVGRGATFQIWHPAAFETYQQAARQRLQSRPEGFKLIAAKEKGLE